MVTNELISYIKTEQAKGTTREQITQTLVSQGWVASDIEQGFTMVANNEVVPPVAMVSSPISGYAGFWRRVAANIIDSSLMYIVVTIIFLVSGIFVSEPIVGALAFPVAMIAVVLYHILSESSVHQATIGKWLVGIKVTDYANGRISIGRSCGRYFSKIISGLTFGIGFLMVAFTEKEQALHDMIASTLVVRDRMVSTGKIVLYVILSWIILAIVAGVLASTIFFAALGGVGNFDSRSFDKVYDAGVPSLDQVDTIDMFQE